MYDEDQDVDDLDWTLVCPYDSNHRVSAARMTHHLLKCRKNFLVNETESEKTICPFNPEHVILSQEMDCHKMLCPEKPEVILEDDLSEDRRNEVASENCVGAEAEKTTKPHSTCESGLRTDEKSEETGCVSGLKVGGIGKYDVVSQTTDKESIIMPTENGNFVENGETRLVEENRAKDEPKCDFEDRSMNAVSHMAGFEPQDHNIAIEKQLSQSNGNSPSSGDEPETESSTDGSRHESEEHFDYKKYAPTKEERDEFLKLISLHKMEQSTHEEKYETVLTQYSTPPWLQNYTYVTQQYQTGAPFQNPGMSPGYITIPTTYPVMTTMPAQSPYPTPYTFQPASGPAGYIQPPVQGINYDYGPVYPSRPPYRPSYRRRNYHSNHMYNRHMHNNHNNYYNGHNHNNHSHYSNGYNNGYYYSNSNDSHGHADTDSNSSGQSDVGLSEEGLCNGNSHHHESRRPPRANKRILQPKCSVSLVKVENTNIIMEKIVQIITDTDDESPGSFNGNMSDVSPEPMESSEISAEKRSENEKLKRKLKKKLSEISQLEGKKNGGGKLDCDQLKKLSRKRDLEEELAALSLN